MKAAIITHPGNPPQIGNMREPLVGDNETVLTVTAAPLTPITKLIAAGRHYAGGDASGAVPGIDGVGIDPDGRKVYFLFPKTPFGAMAEKTLVMNGMFVPVPDGLDDAGAAAIATAGTASWHALSLRARVEPGQSVLIAGATGAAGALAIQVARHLGAGKVIAVGRAGNRLARLDADVKIQLDDDADEALRAAFDEGVDIVLDYVWGEPASRILNAAAMNRGARTGEPRLRYVVLGIIAGEKVSVHGDMLRSSGLELLGNGIGSIAVSDVVAAAAQILKKAAPEAGFDPKFTSLPLEKAPDVWNGSSDIRYVFEPGS